MRPNCEPPCCPRDPPCIALPSTTSLLCCPQTAAQVAQEQHCPKDVIALLTLSPAVQCVVDDVEGGEAEAGPEEDVGGGGAGSAAAP